MFSVIFEVVPSAEGKAKYMKIAGEIRDFLENREGFISMERFESLNQEGKMLSLSFWESEEAISIWRNMMDHRMAQKAGRENLFESYRIRVAEVVRDYTHESRSQAPNESNNTLL